MATLAGAGGGGAVGGLLGAVVGMGIPEYEAKRYEGAVKDGGVLLPVYCNTSEQIDALKSLSRKPVRLISRLLAKLAHHPKRVLTRHTAISPAEIT